jgi:Transposase
VAKKRVGRYPKEFRRMAVERLKSCDNIVALARELGVHRRLLYKWRDQLDPIEFCRQFVNGSEHVFVSQAFITGDAIGSNKAIGHTEHNTGNLPLIRNAELELAH